MDRTDVMFLALKHCALPEIPIDPNRILWVSRPKRPERWHAIWDAVFLSHRLASAGIAVYHASVPTWLTPRGRFKLVSMIHDVIPLLYPEDYAEGWDAKQIYRRKLKSSLQGNHIFANSEATKRDLVDKFGVSLPGISVTHLAASSDFRVSSHAECESFRHGAGLPSSYVLYIGGFSARKNVRSLLRAYARLVNLRGRTKLVLAGGMSAAVRESLQSLMQELGIASDVHFFGHVKDRDLPKLYAGAEIFVYPSLYEGFGLPVLEAMASGTPVVTGRGSSLSEVAGGAALLVNPENIDELAGAMRRLLEDPGARQELASLGRTRAAEFSWDRCARETIEGYRSLFSACA